MTHPILALQSALAAALAQDGVLSALVGEAGIFDAPPKGRRPPYVTFARHDVVPRDGDLAPGHEHRIVVHAWAGEASRKAVLAICDAVLATALGADLGA
ncbi:MAG TPA: DUF3168 domain-containing protein, partial [Alphaproteobacteria bacterium]|nr:DUF3168 domain-containing protein [Alphaproteobacteria bacterium]